MTQACEQAASRIAPRRADHRFRAGVARENRRADCSTDDSL